jgi:uncharacterized membrane protein YjjB (DUF3815 family)
MSAYPWMMFTAAVFGCIAYLVCRLGVPTTRLVAAIAAAAVFLGIIGGLYIVKSHEAQLMVERSTPIDRAPLKTGDRAPGK